MNYLSLVFILLLSACGKKPTPRYERLRLTEEGKASVVLIGAKTSPEFLHEAAKLGIKIEGESLLRLTGDAKDLNFLNIPAEEDFSYASDAPVEVHGSNFGEIDSGALYQAKADFGLLSFWQSHPDADGRNVIVGVLDDGISPNQSAFVTTTDGKRKLLRKGGNSSLASFTLISHSEGYATQIEEKKSFSGDLDLNQDGVMNVWNANVSSDGAFVCLDLNIDDEFGEGECKRTFSSSGEYFTLPKAPTQTLLAEVDTAKKILRLTQSELNSHGEGVAAVMAGHRIGNIKGFDGVAPGAQIVDYDLSEFTQLAQENEYTMAKILLGLEWLAQNGAEVLNVSYSLFFTNTQSQVFMAKAIQSLVDKYNVVITFSAGNNGPALGSLNRRLTYPPSVLVAGAYVSKELDERVHGVTGIPEEGRVVYYSSRGPGAGGVGPMLISPLSSLTPSSSDAGFMAFNGTSSASPALAGAAAVLISVLKKEKLKVDATTVVQALRLSARQLRNEAFITQGYGLPQVPKALKIYKELLLGKSFSYVTHVINRGGLDGTTAESIVLRKSAAQDVESYRINLKGILSKLAPADSTTNLLVPIDIKYTNGISGANELWVSVAESKFFVDVEIDRVLDGKAEGFGEIRLYSKTDQSLLAIIPVTAINDLRVKSFYRTELEASSQEGARIHVNVPSHIKALKVKYRILQGEGRFLSVGAYSPDFIKIKNSATSEFFLATPKAGHYQITLHMVGGTKRGAKVEFELEEVQLDLNSRVSFSDKGKITLSNLTHSPLQGDIVIMPKSKVIKSLLFNNRTTAPEIALSLSKGHYQVELVPAGAADLSYFYSSCNIREKLVSGTEIPQSAASYRVTTEAPVNLVFRCVPFDFGIEQVENMLWQLKVMAKLDEVKIRMEIGARSKKEFTLPALPAGSYQIDLMNTLSSDRITLGEIELL